MTFGFANFVSDIQDGWPCAMDVGPRESPSQSFISDTSVPLYRFVHLDSSGCQRNDAAGRLGVGGGLGCRAPFYRYTWSPV